VASKQNGLQKVTGDKYKSACSCAYTHKLMEFILEWKTFFEMSVFAVV
jgi:hypothetical protein